MVIGCETQQMLARMYASTTAKGAQTSACTTAQSINTSIATRPLASTAARKILYHLQTWVSPIMVAAAHQHYQQ